MAQASSNFKVIYMKTDLHAVTDLRKEFTMVAKKFCSDFKHGRPCFSGVNILHVLFKQCYKNTFFFFFPDIF